MKIKIYKLSFIEILNIECEQAVSLEDYIRPRLIEAGFNMDIEINQFMDDKNRGFVFYQVLRT